MLDKMEMNYQMENPIIFEKEGTKNACRLCGQYIQKGEHYSLVVVPMNYQKEHKNFFVHTEEWEPFKEGADNMEALMEKLSLTKKPRTKNATPVDEKAVLAFKKVLQVKEVNNEIIYSKEMS